MNLGVGAGNTIQPMTSSKPLKILLRPGSWARHWGPWGHHRYIMALSELQQLPGVVVLQS